jgi:hypothetical protein
MDESMKKNVKMDESLKTIVKMDEDGHLYIIITNPTLFIKNHHLYPLG